IFLDAKARATAAREEADRVADSTVGNQTPHFRVAWICLQDEIDRRIEPVRFHDVDQGVHLVERAAERLFEEDFEAQCCCCGGGGMPVCFGRRDDDGIQLGLREKLLEARKSTAARFIGNALCDVQIDVADSRELTARIARKYAGMQGADKASSDN